jgi:hypothetical protein
MIGMKCCTSTTEFNCTIDLIAGAETGEPQATLECSRNLVHLRVANAEKLSSVTASRAALRMLNHIVNPPQTIPKANVNKKWQPVRRFV